MRVIEEDSDSLGMERMCAGDLMAEHASLDVRTEQSKAECDILAAHICELQFAAVTCNGELSDGRRVMRSWKGQGQRARIGRVLKTLGLARC